MEPMTWEHCKNNGCNICSNGVGFRNARQRLLWPILGYDKMLVSQ